VEVATQKGVMRTSIFKKGKNLTRHGLKHATSQ
jgi:hypothetical protein